MCAVCEASGLLLCAASCCKAAACLLPRRIAAWTVHGICGSACYTAMVPDLCEQLHIASLPCVVAQVINRGGEIISPVEVEEVCPLRCGVHVASLSRPAACCACGWLLI